MSSIIYEFNENSGSILYDRLGNYNGTLQWFDPDSPPFTTQKWNGNCLWINNESETVNGRVQVNNPTGLDDLQDFTIHVALYKELFNADQNVILSRGGDNGWKLFITGDNNFAWHQSGVAPIVNDTTGNFNDFSLLSVRNLCGDIQLFLNGEPDSSYIGVSYIDSLSNGLEMIIGQDSASGVNPFYGAINDLTIHTSGQLNSEILKHYNSLKPISPSVTGEVTTNFGTTGTPNVVVTMPSGIESGQLLMAYVGGRSATAGWGVIETIPTGWTSVRDIAVGITDTGVGGFDINSDVFYRMADGLELGSYQWSFNKNLLYSVGVGFQIRDTVDPDLKPIFGRTNTHNGALHPSNLGRYVLPDHLVLHFNFSYHIGLGVGVDSVSPYEMININVDGDPNAVFAIGSGLYNEYPTNIDESFVVDYAGTYGGFGMTVAFPPNDMSGLPYNSPIGTGDHIWQFSPIAGTNVPELSGTLDGTIDNYSFLPAGDTEVSNGNLYWTDKGGISFSQSKYVAVPNVSGLNQLDEFTLHFFGTQVSTAAPVTLISRGGSISGWEFSYDTTSTLRWTQSGISDYVSTSISPSYMNRKIELFSVRRLLGQTQFFYEGLPLGSSVSGGSLPAGADAFDLLFHVAEDRIDEVSDRDFKGITDEIRILEYGQTDTAIRDYYRSLQVTNPQTIGVPSYGEGSGFTVNVPIAPNYREGETLIAFIGTDRIDGADVFTPTFGIPSGWNLITVAQNPNANVHCNSYYKIADAIEPTGYAWTITSADARRIGATMVRVIIDDKPSTLKRMFIASRAQGAGIGALIDGVHDSSTSTDLQLRITRHGLGTSPNDPLLISGVKDVSGGEILFEQHLTHHHFTIAEHDNDDIQFFHTYVAASGGETASINKDRLIMSINGFHGSLFTSEVLNNRGLFNSLVGL